MMQPGVKKKMKMRVLKLLYWDFLLIAEIFPQMFTLSLFTLRSHDIQQRNYFQAGLWATDIAKFSVVSQVAWVPVLCYLWTLTVAGEQNMTKIGVKWC